MIMLINSCKHELIHGAKSVAVGLNSDYNANVDGEKIKLDANTFHYVLCLEQSERYGNING